MSKNTERGEKLTEGEISLLDAIGCLQHTNAPARWSRAHPKWAKTLLRLREAGLIEGADELSITPAGRAALSQQQGDQP